MQAGQAIHGKPLEKPPLISPPLPPPPPSSSSSSSSSHHHHHFSLPSNLPSSSTTFPPPPKIAYFISGTDDDGARFFRLLKAIYHPRNHYLLHLDGRSSKDQRDELARLVGSVPVFVDADNVNVIERANSVREERPSSLALVLHGGAIMWRSRRDWAGLLISVPRITLSFLRTAFSRWEKPSIHVATCADFLHVLWKEYQRITEVIVDPGLYLVSKGRMFTGNKKRTLNAYRFFTGSPPLILSRKLVEFAILRWDNLLRKLLLFFSNIKYSQGDYFQTHACNSKDFSKTVVNSNLRFTVYDDDPRDLSVTDLKKMLSSGAAFAGNFCANDPVLDKIDSLVLHRTAGMILPGGCCLGGRGRG
ncbi:unnamed protein product [Camellia sinensis]